VHRFNAIAPQDHGGPAAVVEAGMAALRANH